MLAVAGAMYVVPRNSTRGVSPSDGWYLKKPEYNFEVGIWQSPETPIDVSICFRYKVLSIYVIENQMLMTGMIGSQTLYNHSWFPHLPAEHPSCNTQSGPCYR